MTNRIRYSIDTSALLDGWIRYYPRDVVPGLWDNLEVLIQQGELKATEEVLHELKKKDDDVHAWAKKQKSLIVPIDEKIQQAVTYILQNHKKLIDTRKNRSGADPFVIALARVNECAVVSGERATHSPERPNIPDVCTATGIRCIDILQLCREKKWIFRM
jgi:hypothetical protein